MVRPNDAAERELVCRAQRGDSEAFGHLVAEHQQVVYRIALRITASRLEAEDVAQEAFVQAYRTLDRFDSDRPLGPWLYRIARNTALNWIKRSHPQIGLGEWMAEEDAILGPEVQVLANETASRLREEIANLPPHYRAAVELRHFRGLSYQQMSEVLGVPLSDVKSWLFRARSSLRKVLEAGDGP